MNPYDLNRKFFFLPVNTGYVDKGDPDERCQRFYVDRSGHGLHCAIVGNVVLPNGFGSNEVCAKISSSDSWYLLARQIKEEGAKAGIQLSSTWNGYQGIKSFIAQKGTTPVAEYMASIADLSLIDIKQIFVDLRFGSELAINAGFTHIQLHAAHGYLFSLLADSHFSKHFEFVLEKINEWANFLISENIESSLRFSLLTGDRNIDENGRTEMIDRLMYLPFSFFDVSSGFYNINKRLIYPSEDGLLITRRNSTLDLARRFDDKQFIMSGKLSEYSAASLPNNIHIGLCRDLIANPNFLRDRSMGCNNCMKCHYHSRGDENLVCGQW